MIFFLGRALMIFICRQNLIIEGCYVPFDWRKDFTEEYLADIQFICLAMTDDYIDQHFFDIAVNGSIIESRLNDSEYTVVNLKEDNRKYFKGFPKAGEQVTMIDDCFEKVIEALINE